MTYWAPLALSTATGALLALPLAPAMRELWLRRDAAPLPIAQHDAHIENFALAFEEHLRPLQKPLAEAVSGGTVHECVLEDGSKAVLVGIAYEDSAPALQGCSVEHLTLYGCPVVLADDMRFRREVYAAASLWSGKRSTFRALLCQGDLCLAEGNRIWRWVHAGGTLKAEPRCELYGRASSATSIYLERGCRFERVYAPEIRTSATQAPAAELADFGARSTVEARRGRLRIHGELRMRDGEALQADTIARSIRLGAHCLILGSLKSTGDLIIGDGTLVDGSVIASGSLRIGRGACIRGPVLAEDDIELGAGSYIGGPSLPTTISASSIRVHVGATVYGTLWARSHGQVEA